MCLIKDKKVRNNHHKEDGYLVAYKILTHCDMSPFMNSQYKVGVNHAEFGQRSRDLDSTSLNFQFGGLHLMLSLKEAKEYAHSCCYASKIIKVYYKSEDVIAYGHSVSCQYAKHQGRSVVVKSCLIKSLKPVCPIAYA